MSLKPVWIILVAPTDLVELAIKHFTGRFPGYAAQRYTFGFSITTETSARLYLNTNAGLRDFEEEEVAQLDAWQVTDFAHSVESKDPHLTIELITRLSEHTDLAIDDDMGLILRVQDFLALTQDQQVSFLIGNGI